MKQGGHQAKLLVLVSRCRRDAMSPARQGLSRAFRCALEAAIIFKLPSLSLLLLLPFKIAPAGDYLLRYEDHPRLPPRSVTPQRVTQNLHTSTSEASLTLRCV
jgi:hypothetical protein